LAQSSHAASAVVAKHLGALFGVLSLSVRGCLGECRPSPSRSQHRAPVNLVGHQSRQSRAVLGAPATFLLRLHDEFQSPAPSHLPATVRVAAPAERAHPAGDLCCISSSTTAGSSPRRPQRRPGRRRWHRPPDCPQQHRPQRRRQRRSRRPSTRVSLVSRRTRPPPVRRSLLTAGKKSVTWSPPKTDYVC